MVSIGKQDQIGSQLELAEERKRHGQEDIDPKDEKVKKKFLDTWNNYNNFILENKTNDLSESQPTAGNIKGGLTTIEEKACGKLQKIGKKVKYIEVLEPAEEPKNG